MTSPAYALAQDPAYLAFLRASGLTQAVATTDAARRTEAINMALGIQNDDLAANGEQERRGISGSQESRGVFRSGETLRRMSDQETGQARRKSALELAASGQLGDIQANLLSQNANQQVRGSELALTLGQNRTLADGEAAIGTTAAAATSAVPAYQFAPLSIPGVSVPTATSTARTPFTGSGSRRTGRQQEY